MLRIWKGWYKPTLLNVAITLLLLYTTIGYWFWWIKDDYHGWGQIIWFTSLGLAVVVLLMDLGLQKFIKNPWIVNGLELLTVCSGWGFILYLL